MPLRHATPCLAGALRLRYAITILYAAMLLLRHADTHSPLYLPLPILLRRSMAELSPCLILPLSAAAIRCLLLRHAMPYADVTLRPPLVDLRHALRDTIAFLLVSPYCQPMLMPLRFKMLALMPPLYHDTPCCYATLSAATAFRFAAFGPLMPCLRHAITIFAHSTHAIEPLLRCQRHAASRCCRCHAAAMLLPPC